MKDHSLIPDKATGWQQRQLIAKLHQFPLIFMNPAVDMVSKSLTSFGNTQTYRVVYMGPRYNSNMKAFKSYCLTENNPKVDQAFVYGLKQLNKFAFKHSHESQKFFPIRISEYRLFTGMNPTFKKDDLKFDSDFEGGNLDLAIYVNPAEYDLVMRVDSNTKGHTSWFYFKVSNAGANQKIKFNVINFSKKYLLYKDGMKPYVYKKSVGQWVQAGINVTYNGRKFRYEGLSQTRYQCLSFVYDFKDSEEVYFAYCIPYSYSYLLHRLQQLRSKLPHLMKVNYDCESTGGLPIPIVTITNFSNTGQKINVLCTARLHPGETQGSWMMDGFIQQLLSPDCHYLRDKALFKLIPMVNVDGVVLGNFRTGIMGRDLNRCFNSYDQYNEIILTHRLADEIKPLIYMDFHGHSAKRNVFIYGPDYKLQDRNYLLCRLLPKLISKQTEAFRYYSCSFNISRSKMTTGRAVMMRSFKVEFSYTIQASSHAFGPVKAQTCFLNSQYQTVGAKIAESLTQFIRILKVLPKREEVKGKKAQETDVKSQQGTKKQNKNQVKESKQVSQSPQTTPSKSNLLDFDSLQCFNVIQKNLFRQIMKDQSKIDEEQQKQGSSQSDAEDQGNDYSNSDINKIMDAKFEPRQKQKQKSKEQTSIRKIPKSKKQKLKEEKFINQSKKSVQISPKKRKNFLEKNKSFSIKNIDSTANVLSNSQTIDIMQNQKRHYESFEEKASKLIESNPFFMGDILAVRQKNRPMIQNVDLLTTPNDMMDRNHVHYDWSGHKKQQRVPSKKFNFEIEQYFEPVVSMKKESKTPNQKVEKKKSPLLSIKKSILPILGKSAELYRQGNQRSMLSEILEEHERKKKEERNIRIMFL